MAFDYPINLARSAFWTSKEWMRGILALLLSYSSNETTEVDKIKSENKKKEYPAFLYRMLSGDSFESPIFFLKLFLIVALDRRPAQHRAPPLNHLSSLYTLNNPILATRIGACHA